MHDFELYYWPMPFRGQFIRGILAFAGKQWTEHGSEEINAIMSARHGEQPVPFTGPPALIDHQTDFALSQMPAIALYLGERFGLVPGTPDGRAMTAKIVNDANDVIDELTCDGGREMWTKEKWHDFVPRLKRWMGIWEEIGARNGLGTGNGFLLGSDGPGVADIVTAILWTTMGDRFSVIAKLFDETAPRTAGLAKRMMDYPALAALKKRAFEDYGDAYCGGEIEKSLRAVAG